MRETVCVTSNTSVDGNTGALFFLNLFSGHFIFPMKFDNHGGDLFSFCYKQG